MLLHGVWFSILDALSGGARLSTYYVIRLILSRSYRQESFRYAAVAVVGCLPAADAGPRLAGADCRAESVRLRGRCFAGADQWQSWRRCSAASLHDLYRALAGVGHALDAAGSFLSTVQEQ